MPICRNSWVQCTQVAGYQMDAEWWRNRNSCSEGNSDHQYGKGSVLGAKRNTRYDEERHLALERAEWKGEGVQGTEKTSHIGMKRYIQEQEHNVWKGTGLRKTGTRWMERNGLIEEQNDAKSDGGGGGKEALWKRKERNGIMQQETKYKVVRTSKSRYILYMQYVPKEIWRNTNRQCGNKSSWKMKSSVEKKEIWKNAMCSMENERDLKEQESAVWKWTISERTRECTRSKKKKRAVRTSIMRRKENT